MRKLLSWFSTIFLAVIFILLINFNIFAYNSPGKPINYVSDFANILTDDQENTINRKIEDLEKSSSNEIAVVTIISLENDSIENYAVKLFEEWAIGKTKKDNGLLLIVSMNDKKSRIEVGYGLEGALTDIQSYRILENYLTPKFKEQKYFEGLNNTVDQLILVTKGEYTNDTSANVEKQISDFISFIVNGGIFCFFFPLLIFATLMAKSRNSYWLGGILGVIIGVITFFVIGLTLLSVGLFILAIIIGFIADFIFSKMGVRGVTQMMSSMSRGSGSRGGSGGGFGGFGGGRSGGGGASSSW